MARRIADLKIIRLDWSEVINFKKEQYLKCGLAFRSITTAFAMGLGIPVVWTARATSVSDLHFDTRQYNHIVWQSASELCEQ